MKQLTRQQLQNDLDAARKREAVLRQENETYRQNYIVASEVLKQAQADAEDWRGAFKILCKLATR